MKRLHHFESLRHILLACAGCLLFALACGDDGLCEAGALAGSPGETCYAYSSGSESRPCSQRDASDCEAGGSCILDQVCDPIACNGGYCANECQKRTVCVPY